MKDKIFKIIIKNKTKYFRLRLSDEDSFELERELVRELERELERMLERVLERMLDRERQ